LLGPDVLRLDDSRRAMLVGDRGKPPQPFLEVAVGNGCDSSTGET
jgi:hypothetical protein